MAYRGIPENSWRAMHDIAKHSETIHSKVSQIIELLNKSFSEPDVLESARLEVLPQKVGDKVANIISPVGNGRLILRVTIGDTGPQGVLTLERQLHSERDETVWEPVWGLIVPVDGSPYAGQGEGALKIPLGVPGSWVDNAIFSLGMSMLYAIADGPQDFE